MSGGLTEHQPFWSNMFSCLFVLLNWFWKDCFSVWARMSEGSGEGKRDVHHKLDLSFHFLWKPLRPRTGCETSLWARNLSTSCFHPNQNRSIHYFFFLCCICLTKLLIPPSFFCHKFVFKVTHIRHDARAGVNTWSRKVMKTPLSCHLYLTTLDITNHLDGCDSMENCETEFGNRSHIPGVSGYPSRWSN